MKFTVSRDALQRELGFVQGAVEKRNVIPALQFLLLESVNGNTVQVTSTDLDLTMQSSFEADIKTQGSMCVSARKLFDIIKAAPDKPISFEVDDKGWVKVQFGSSKYKVPGIPRGEFPEFPSYKKAEIQLPSDMLRSAIERTIFAITQEESRYTLSGAKVILKDKNLRMVTSDGHRLAIVEASTESEGSVDVLVPRKALSELAKLVSSEKGSVSFGVDDRFVHFGINSRVLVSRLLSGNFPDYEMVIPKSNDKQAEFNCNDLGSAIRRVALMADDRSKAIKLQIEPNVLNISSSSPEEGEAHESVETDYTGDSIEIGFNAGYLQEFINAVDTDKVVFEFKDSNSQGLLRPAEQNGSTYRYVVMPMRL